MSSLQGKRIVLGVCGGIAAYKACELVRDLQRAGADIRVVMTLSAMHFVSALSLQALTGHSVRTSRFDEEAERAMSHIELARWADFLLIAPATANTMARLAQGMADDLLTTLYVATEAPVVVCPAMNRIMWQHPSTQRNVATLEADGAWIVAPDDGAQACGEIGTGRLPESDTILDALRLHNVRNLLQDKAVLITAGPTREPLDPVRYISNHSSGKMGYALAKACVAAGAKVTLISGPVAMNAPKGVTFISVQRAQEMYAAAFEHLTKDSIVIGCAAVADYRPKIYMAQKIKKKADAASIELTPNRDIIADIAQDGRAALVIGFAAETHRLLAHAKIKRKAKTLDFIIANQVSEVMGFNQDENSVTILGESTEVVLPLMPKLELSGAIVEYIAHHISARSASETVADNAGNPA